MSERTVWLMTQEQQFLNAIAKDEMDELTRNVYGDWLDEHDRPEEANRQRAWCASKRWIMEFVKQFGSDFDYEERGLQNMDYERLMKAADDYVDRGDYLTQHGATDWQDVDCDEFWEHYKVVTGRDLGDRSTGNFFSCSC